MRSVSSVIGGKAVPGAPGGTFTSRNPSRTDEVVAEVSYGDAGTFVEACRTARAAQTAWADVPAPLRGRTIAHIGRLVEQNAEALARIVTAEIGKPAKEAMGEVREIIDTCDFFLGEGRRLYGETVPSEMPDKQLFTYRTPVGVAAIVTAGNFPVAVPSWYLVPALLCGNTVVWKPADYAAASARALYELFVRAGLPAGVLNLVLTDGPTTSAGLEQALEAGLVDKIGFTGSTAVGRRIGELAGRHLQSPCLELGGKNPMVVTPEADLDLAVEGALFSGFGTAGQRCTSLGTVIVHESVHDEFLARFSAAVAGATIGDPTTDVLYGPMLDQKFADSYETYLGWIGDHHKVLGSTGTGRITGRQPSRRLRRRPRRRDLLPPGDRRRGASRRQGVPRGDVRSDRRRDDVLDVRRGARAGEPARLRVVVLHLHRQPEGGVHLPPSHRCRNGQRQQLHVRGGGAPAVRR